MRIPFILLSAILLATVPAVHAQTKSSVKGSIPKSTLLRDGAFRRNGVTMRLQAGRATRLSAPLTLENGTVIRPSGIIVSPDGTRQLLADNHAVNMQGGIVLLRDDMLTPGAIAQQEKTVTGSTGEIQFTSPSEPGTTAVSPRLTAKLLRAEQRLAMLEEMTNRLEQRTKVQSAATGAVDRQLSQVDKQLRQTTTTTETSSDAPASDAPGVR